ncbi:MAG: recombination mediator RecR [Bacilli bacterium]|jgi:recombination protein RecR
MKELQSLNNLVDAFKSFPSIGSKTAERMGYSVLDMSEEEVNNLVKAINEAKKEIHPCPICGLLTEEDKCSVCKDPNRNHSICIVLSYPKDVINFEKLESYHGVYHVLGGVISSVHGIGPDDLKINELISRISKEGIKEIIIATNPTLEGETTALYLSRILKKYDVKVTRLAYGLPAGGQLDYVDELTIEKALDNRTDLK